MTGKPLVWTMAAGEESERRREPAGTILMVSYQSRYSPAQRYIHEQIKAGAIGRIQFVTGLQHHGWYWEQRGQWRQDPELSGGGQLIDWGSHLMDCVMYATSLRISAVMAHENRYDLDVDVDMTISARFENGAIGSFAHVGNAAAPAAEDMGFYGSEGTLLVRGVDYNTVDELRHYDARQELVDVGELPAQSSPDRNFVDAILGRDQVRSSGGGGLDVLLVNEACWESARTGREVAVSYSGGR